MEIFRPPSDAEGAQREIFEAIRRHAVPAAIEPEGKNMNLDAFSLREGARQLRLKLAVVGQMPPEPPTLRGRLGAWIIRKIRRALAWYTAQILQFHQSVTEVIEQHVKTIEEIQGIVDELRRQEIAARKALESWAGPEIARLGEGFKSELSERVAELRALLEQTRAAAEEQNRNRGEAIEARLGDSERKILSLRRGLMSQEMRLTVLLEHARKRMDQLSASQLSSLVREDAHKVDAIYLTFEDQFRGTREDIQERFRVYLPILKSHGIGGAETPLLDLGCGRGEWLEILRQEGMYASGVDNNRVMLTECRIRELNVVEGDAVEYLRSLDTESLGGVTGFHIIEHLPFPRLIDLFDETVRALKPGGLALFETPNPRNVLVGTERFYFDPTHRNPLPSPLVRFLAEERGLCRVEVLELHPWPDGARVPEAGCAVAERFNQLFYGPVDYAIMGWKA
jgi:SAM-dependent methyltransferase